MESLLRDGQVGPHADHDRKTSEGPDDRGPDLQAPALLALAAACFGGLFSPVPIISMFPIIFGPIAHEFGWGRGQALALVLVFVLANAIATPILGKVTDRRGARAVALVAVPALGLAAFELSQVGDSAPALVALIAILGLTCPMLVLNSKVIAGWFDRRRRISLTISGLTISLMSGGLLQLNGMLLTSHGWRSIFLVYGAVAWLAELPLLWLFYREKIKQDVGSAAVQGVSAAERRRSRVFWMIVAATTLNVMVWLALQAHLIELLTDRGLGMPAAVNIMSPRVSWTPNRPAETKGRMPPEKRQFEAVSGHAAKSRSQKSRGTATFLAGSKKPS